jgi:O-antigen ligase
VILLFASAALVYAPYAGDTGSVARPKGIVALLAAFALGALALLRDRSEDGPRPRDRVLGVPLAVYMSAWMLSAAAVWPGLEWTWKLLRYELVLGLSIGAAVLLPRLRTVLLWCLPWTGMLIAVTILLQAHGANPPGLPDDWVVIPNVKLPAGTFVHRNIPAYLLALCVAPTLWALTRARSSKTRLLWIVGLGVVAAALVATRCRGAWLATILAATVLIVVRRSWVGAPKSSRVRRAGAAALAVTVLAALVMTLPASALPVRVSAGVSRAAIDRKVRTNTIVDEGSLVKRFDVVGNHRTISGRFRYWRHAANLILTAPVLGHGPGSFRKTAQVDLADRYYVPNRAHNTFLESGAEAGVPALLALAALFLLGLLRAWRYRNAVAEASILAAMVVVVGLFFCLEPLTSGSAVYYGLVLGSALGLPGLGRCKT